MKRLPGHNPAEWDRAKISRLCAMRESGADVREIASRFGIAGYTVLEILARENHARPVKWTPEEDDKLKELLIERNLPPDEVASVLKRSRASIHTRATRLGLTCKTKPRRKTLQTRRNQFTGPFNASLATEKKMEALEPLGKAGEFKGCRWPYGDPADAVCCGREIHKLSYCKHHYQMAYEA